MSKVKTENNESKIKPNTTEEKTKQKEKMMKKRGACHKPARPL
jgi:hypothetical protein